MVPCLIPLRTLLKDKRTEENIFAIRDTFLPYYEKHNTVTGVFSCGVTWGFRLREELEAFEPDFLIDEAEEIAPIIFNSTILLPLNSHKG
jgi:phosphoglycolate phosphatase-like HAD superfamily hydrolase